jgi:hypothetical protein
MDITTTLDEMAFCGDNGIPLSLIILGLSGDDPQELLWLRLGLLNLHESS